MKPQSEYAKPIKDYVQFIDKEKRNHTISLGYIFLSVSTFLFIIVEGDSSQTSGDNSLTIFFLHYLIALVYVVILAVNGFYGIRESWRSRSIDKTIILLNLFLISAFALNRVVPVFADSVNWLCVYLTCTSVVLLSYRYFDAVPSWINRFQHFVLGSVVIFYLYQTVYVANLYAIGAVGILFLGVGAHIFVPLTLLIASAVLISISIKKYKASAYWIAAGSLSTLVAVLLFIGEWNSRVANIEKLANQSVIYEDNGLPAWVNVAKRVDKDWISEKIIKSDMVYTTHNDNTRWDSFRFTTQWDEKKKHDPLVFISSLITKCNLSFDDRIKILQAVFADRHNANERLWSGDNLTTSYILSDVDIYPDLRIAYVEKYLNVRNNITAHGRNSDQQEAIYTFHLPEGSVATSLSLWIGGKEEKGILTSKQRATNAYTTIVGVEQRDPSVIHWQEGNTVTVRVFPCTPEEERKFKIGFTCPLIAKNGQLQFRNIPFKGPSSSGSRETFRVRFIGGQPGIKLPGFVPDGKGAFITEQSYDPDFQLTFEASSIPPNQFTFDGYKYTIKPYQPKFRTASFQKVYLDLNSSWTNAEVEAAKELLSTRKLFVVSDDGFETVTKENWNTLTEPIHRQNFSVFPFHRINAGHESIVITKGRKLSPQLADFKGSKFSEAIGQYFSSGNRVAVYNIDDHVSTYLGSLREFRTVDFASGSLEQLNGWLTDNKFPQDGESSEKIVLHDSGITIEKTSDEQADREANTAPDHLVRLFAYNDIMRKVGSHYFDGDFINEELVGEASKAYVVSPVSSLIVLETQHDYDRFGIEESVNSLQNATRQSTGAVPEPHEWALIILFALFLIYLRIRRLRLCHPV
jgi:XrtN system VIT domain protein